MILFKMFYFVRSDFKENSKGVLPFTCVEIENGNAQFILPVTIESFKDRVIFLKVREL